MKAKVPFEETKLGTALSGIIDLVVSGLLWLLCCVPIITAGTATVAFYYTVVKCVRHERGHVYSTFFGAFKRNFKQSILLWLAVLVYAVIAAADIWASKLMGDEAGFMAYGFYLFLMPGALILPWLFPYVSRFENSFGGSIKASFYISIKNFGKTLLILLILAAFGFVCWLAPLLAPFLPGLCCLFVSYQIEPALKALAEGVKDENADKWYDE